MALNINGTTGISGVDGSASTPALQGTDSNTGINFASDTVNINTGGSTRATVDSSGRFLIGTTTGDPYGNRYLTVNSNSGTTAIEVRSATNGDGRIIFTDSTSVDSGAYKGQILYDQTNDYMSFNTNGSNERMRIDSSGNIGIGTNDPTNADSADGGLQIRPNHSQGSPQIGFKRASGGSASTAVIFVNGNVGKGSITYDASGTAYNTSSDYRLKENVVSISDGITRLKTLKPSRFNFIDDETNTLRDGFLAHEVTAVPEAITGIKDEIDSDNKPVYQGLDQGKLVPLLTAALQEAITKIETLETKVAALEAA